MRLVFMGTPDFAVPSFKALVDGGWDVVAVVTQPDRRRGRGQKVSYSPVKEFALEHSIPVLQPARVSNNDFIQELKEINPDAIIVVAFGQIIPPEIVHMPPHGCINVHASLLPKYRGAAPIHHAIIDGCRETGITTMLIDEGCDTGGILLKEAVPILESDTAGSLEKRLAPIGAKVLLETLDKLTQGELEPVAQDDAAASYAHKLKRDIGKIDWSCRGQAVVNLVRGVSPWPGAYTFHRGQMLKVWEASAQDQSAPEASGTITDITDDGLCVAADDRLICLHVVQPPNRPRISGRDYANGYHVEVGEVLGGEPNES
ncbi:MAG: methionyl-tRNA formyltransferase [Firmicutes bacterium]|nr:methionyl-tRNA formyltransferase [Bacillota bacterium]